MDFIVDGERYSLTKQEVEARMRGVEPGSIYQYAVEVNGVRYPVKQVFRVTTGLEHFTTQRARDVLRRLGLFDRSADARATQPSAAEPNATGWILEILTLTGVSYEFELDGEEDIQALEAEIAHKIGDDGSYQTRSRRAGAVGGASVLTIAWKNVAAASLYQRQDHPALLHVSP